MVLLTNILLNSTLDSLDVKITNSINGELIYDSSIDITKLPIGKYTISQSIIAETLIGLALAGVLTIDSINSEKSIEENYGSLMFTYRTYDPTQAPIVIYRNLYNLSGEIVDSGWYQVTTTKTTF